MDFAEGMRHWKRMCERMEAKYGSMGSECEHCPIKGCGAIYEMSPKTDWQKIADEIEIWAEAHPAPEYMTWREYLLGLYWYGEKYHIADTGAIVDQPIPEEIARLLGIKPEKTGAGP